MVEREQQLACHHAFLLSAHNAKAGGHLTHVHADMNGCTLMHTHTHAHTLRQAHVPHTVREQRGNDNALHISRSVCIFLPGQVPLLCVALLTPPAGEGGLGLMGEGLPQGPNHQALPVSRRPTLVPSCHSAGKKPRL